MNPALYTLHLKCYSLMNPEYYQYGFNIYLSQFLQARYLDRHLHPSRGREEHVIRTRDDGRRYLMWRKITG